MGDPTFRIVCFVPRVDAALKARFLSEFPVQGLFRRFPEFKVAAWDFPATLWVFDEKDPPPLPHGGRGFTCNRDPSKHEDRRFLLQVHHSMVA